MAGERKKAVAKVVNLEIAEAALFKSEEIWTCVNTNDKGKHECKS